MDDITIDRDALIAGIEKRMATFKAEDAKALREFKRRRHVWAEDVRSHLRTAAKLSDAEINDRSLYDISVGSFRRDNHAGACPVSLVDLAEQQLAMLRLDNRKSYKVAASGVLGKLLGINRAARSLCAIAVE